jgi:hypothetical protein
VQERDYSPEIDFPVPVFDNECPFPFNYYLLEGYCIDVAGFYTG